MEYKTLNELRHMTKGTQESNLMLGIRNAWEEWILACYDYNPTFNWRDFFDGCFLPHADERSVRLTINRPAYFFVSETDWVKDALEHTFFIVFRIPLFVELDTTEGIA